MKSILGIAFGMALGATMANARGSIGGFNGMYYNTTDQPLYIPGNLDDRFTVMRHGADSGSNLVAYPIAAEEFARLRNVADTHQRIYVKGNNSTHSYKVDSGNEYNELDLIDRRAVMRGGVTR